MFLESSFYGLDPVSSGGVACAKTSGNQESYSLQMWDEKIETIQVAARCVNPGLSNFSIAV